MSKKIRYKGIVATLAQIAADAFAGRISWASDLARPVHYYTDSDYAVLARKDVAETFPEVKITNQAGPVARMVQAGTDGTQSAVSAATARSTIGAQEALGYTPVNKAGDTMTGGLTLTSLVNSATAGVGIRPKVALADGTDSVRNAATFREVIGASDGKELLNWYAPATRPADCNLEPDGLGGLRRFLAPAGIANGPSTTQTSHVLHIGHDNTGGYDTQLASELSTGALRSRAQTAGVWGAWNTVWDSVNLPASAIGKNLLNVADAAAARTLIDVSGAERLNRTIGTTAGTAWIRFAQIDLTAAGGAAIYGVITPSGASVSSGWVNFSASLYAMTMSGSAAEAVLSESHGSNTYLSIGFVVEQDDGTRKRLALYAKTAAPMSVQMSVFTSNGAVATYSGVAPVTTQPTGFAAATAA